MPAYVEALLERTADGLDELGRVMRRNEESRQAASATEATLVERLGTLSETMRAQQTLLAKLAENSIELGKVLGNQNAGGAETEATRALRAIEGHLARLLDETQRNRTTLADELRGEFKLLARTIASSRGGSEPPPRI